MIGPFPPAVGGLANNMGLLTRSSLQDRFALVPFTTAKRRRHTFPNRPHWDSPFYLIYHSFKLFLSLAKRRPQAAYVKTTSDTGFVRDFCLLALCRLFRVPVITHLHGRPRGRLFAREGHPFQRWIRMALGWSRATVVLSPGLAETFSDMFPGLPLVPLANVVDLQRFPPPPPRPARTQPRVLTVGRLSREKGTWDLLDTAAALRDRGRSAEFRLVGIGESPEEEAALRERVKRLGLEDRVIFLGTLRGQDLVREYHAADIFFLPTHAEIFPNVVLEALAAGLPIVTTDVPVIPEMFTEGLEGFRHSPEDVEGFAGSLERLLGDPDLRDRMGREGRRLAEARYGVETAAEMIGDLLAAAAARAPLTVPPIGFRPR